MIHVWVVTNTQWVVDVNYYDNRLSGCYDVHRWTLERSAGWAASFPLLNPPHILADKSLFSIPYISTATAFFQYIHLGVMFSTSTFVTSCRTVTPAWRGAGISSSSALPFFPYHNGNIPEPLSHCCSAYSLLQKSDNDIISQLKEPLILCRLSFLHLSAASGHKK